jgi:hypothetical protein
VTVPIVNDTVDEPNETFALSLSNPTGGAVLTTPSVETVTITNDDPPNGVLGFDVGSVTVTDFAGRSTTEKNFAREQRVRGTPTFLFVAADGKEMTRYTGATRDVREFMELGRYVVEGHWRKQDFQQFYRNPQPEGIRP